MAKYVKFGTQQTVFFKASWWAKSSLLFVPPASLGVFCCHTYLLSKYQELVAFYESGKPMAVPQRLMDMFDYVKEDLDTKPFFKKFLNIFMVNGFDTFYAGSTRSLYGGIVGIPKHFTYETFEDVKKDLKRIRVQETPVVWETVDPQVKDKFLNSLILSDKAKKYSMLYNCILVDNQNYVMYALYPTFLGFFNGIIGEYLSRKLSLKKRPISLTLIIGFLLLSTSACAWISLLDLHKIICEKTAIGELVEYGEEYIEGGIEFSNKQIDRNLALRHLMKDGESKFSMKGNEIYFLGRPGLSPYEKKNIFEEKLAELKKSRE